MSALQPRQYHLISLCLPVKSVANMSIETSHSSTLMWI